MFAIERKLVKVRSTTNVPEFRGEKREHACSVSMEAVMDNEVLELFDPHMRKAFYQKDNGKSPAAEDGQSELSLPRADLALTQRKCVAVQMPLKVKKDFAGYDVIYHRGASPESEIKLGDAKLHDFSFDLQEGGSVLVRWTVYHKAPAEQQGYIDHFAQTELEISLVPPPVKQEDLLPRQSKKPAADKVDRTDPFAGSDLEKQQPETA